jgi:hypothetical protein
LKIKLILKSLNRPYDPHGGSLDLEPFLIWINICYGSISHISFCRTSSIQTKDKNSSFFPAHDVKIELHKIRKIPMGNGRYNNEREKLKLVNGQVSHLPGRTFFWNRKDTDPHCLTVRSMENIGEILSDQYNGISLQVSLKHGLTGLSKVLIRNMGAERPSQTEDLNLEQSFEGPH